MPIEANLAKRLQPNRKIPDPPSQGFKLRKGEGLKSGLGVMGYLQLILEMNETLPKTQKRTNAMIESDLAAEFPKRKVLHNSITTGVSSANFFRQRYNRGNLTGVGKPDRLSIRYDVNGCPVDTRTGKKRITLDEVTALWEKYQPKESLGQLLIRLGFAKNVGQTNLGTGKTKPTQKAQRKRR